MKEPYCTTYWNGVNLELHSDVKKKQVLLKAIPRNLRL